MNPRNLDVRFLKWPSPLLVAGVILAAAVTGCGGDGPGAGAFTVTDSVGVEIVESTAPAWGEGEVHIDPEPLVSIGQDEDGPYLFDFISSVRFLPDGRIALTDGGAREVRVFDSQGGHLASFGRQGRGPGEFSQVYGLQSYGQDSVIVFDAVQRRASVFSLATEEARTVTPSMDGNWAFFGRMGDGSFVAYDPGRGFRPDLEGGLQWVMTDVVAMDPTDGTVSVLAQLPGREQFIEPNGDTRRILPPRYSIQAASEQGLYWAHDESWEIRLFDPQGTLVRILRRPIEPEPLTPERIDAFIQFSLDEVRRREGDEAVPRYRQRFDEAHYGDQLPFFSVAFVDKDQRLWVASSDWPLVRPTPSTWSVFSQEGYLLGEVQAPDGVRFEDAQGDRVVGIWYDEMDVQHVHVYRLAGG